MIPLLTSDQMRALDRNAIETLGIPGVVLMENAARSVLEAMEERYRDVDGLAIAVLCGPGNNGGDGFALARHLHLRGAEVDVVLLTDVAKIKGDALINFKLLEPLGVNVIPWNEQLALDDYDLLIDAIFGTGTDRAPDGNFRAAIQAMNDAMVPVIAVDIPSGVDASTGRVPGEAVLATLTVTLQCAKAGLVLPPGRDFVGDLLVAPISIPEEEDVIADAPFFLPEHEDIADEFPPRPRGAHKGDFGKLLVIGGSRGMSGAVRMVAMAALRSGIGLVKVACPEVIRPEVAAPIPELMTIGLPSTSEGTIAADALKILKPYLAWADAIAIGPGLGTHPETGQFLSALLAATDLPLVIDADGLNLIASHHLIDQLRPGTILTPHPGEFDRLVNSTASDAPAKGNGADSSSKFQASSFDFFSRAEAARSFARDHHVILHLKGAPSISFDTRGQAIVNPTGNPGLATGGAGDVLTGIVGTLRAQAFDAFDAAWIGSYLHGLAADFAVEQLGEISLIAGDVIRYLPAAFRALEEPDEEASESSTAHHEAGGT
jgi:ADP-dependent NAD(P)H-hydrate dehydratase / NAD(P)H-hydrate epimerase